MDFWSSVDPQVREIWENLDQGRIRVAQKNAQGTWEVNPSVKEAILAAFRQAPMAQIEKGWDKIPLKNGPLIVEFVESPVPSCAMGLS